MWTCTMRRFLLLPFLATTTIAFPQMAGNLTDIGSASGALSCEGTSTYGFTPSSTVYVTVDGEYTYTGTTYGSTPSDIFYTPPPPCSSVIIPGFSTASTGVSSSSQTLSITSLSDSNSTTQSSITSTISTWTTICSTTPQSPVPVGKLTTALYSNVSTTLTPECTSVWTHWTTIIAPAPHASDGRTAPHPNPDVKTSAVPTVPVASTFNSFSASVIASTLHATAVTVTVTKKTPVPASNNPTNGGGGNDGGSITFPNDPNGDATLTPNENKPSPTTTPANNNDPGNNNSNNNNNNTPLQPNNASPTNNGQNVNPNPTNNNNPAPANPPPTGNGLGSIINSAFNSPFTTIRVSTSFGAASATVTLVAGVPVQVSSSSVYIGGSYVALPTGTSTAYATVAGQTFTIAPSAIIAGGDTLTINRPASTSYSAVQAAPLAASTITQNGVTVTVEPTAAVISGTTYAIGLNAQPTTLTISGQTLTLNSNGVAFASTTYSPAMTTAAAYIVTTLGVLTISIDSTEAIISGKTYRIGAGALNSKTTAIVDGTTIVFGPDGIEMPRTTIAPTEPSFTDANAASTRTAATKAVSDTSGATSSGAGVASVSRPPTWLSDARCVVVLLLGLATLPVSLVL